MEQDEVEEEELVEETVDMYPPSPPPLSPRRRSPPARSGAPLARAHPRAGARGAAQVLLLRRPRGGIRAARVRRARRRQSAAAQAAQRVLEHAALALHDDLPRLRAGGARARGRRGRPPAQALSDRGSIHRSAVGSCALVRYSLPAA